MFSAGQYDYPLFRPPGEANSVIFQVTLGCSWNNCLFCEMYKTKNFRVKKEDEILAEILAFSKSMPEARKFFLADGDALVLSTAKLLKILSAINHSFKNVQRISAYALPKNINSKSHDELVALREAGLKLIYVGIESGDDELLKIVNKGETFNSTADGLLKAKEAGIKNSVMILTGLGGLKYSEQHAIQSAWILNLVQPEFASTLVLSFPYGEEHYKKQFPAEFISQDVAGLLKELEIFIRHTELVNTIFRSDHASNYLVLKGILSRDKQQMLNSLSYAINNTGSAGLRKEWERGF